LAEALRGHWTEFDWPRFDRYLTRFSSGAVVKRVGYLVETLDLPLPDRRERLERWREHLTAGIALLEPGGEPAGPTQRRWRIRDNVGLGVRS
jgi:predicted transcriptional regulator of viral defense system